jgi:hypothetical protein
MCFMYEHCSILLVRYNFYSNQCVIYKHLEFMWSLKWKFINLFSNFNVWSKLNWNIQIFHSIPCLNCAFFIRFIFYCYYRYLIGAFLAQKKTIGYCWCIFKNIFFIKLFHEIFLDIFFQLLNEFLIYGSINLECFIAK